MEKSVSAVTNKKVSIFLPHDLVPVILSKLPLKLLKRFQCVCKSWSLMFKNPHFINMYTDHLTRYNHSYHADKFLVLHKLLPGVCDSWHCEFYWFSSDKFENWVKLDWPSQFQKDDCNIYIVGSASINGILCLKQRLHNRQLVLWNPTTTEAKLIPPSPVENRLSDPPPWRFLHGFGYDHVSDDYKVVQMIDYNMRDDENGILTRELIAYDPLWEIYSLKTNSWKKLDFDIDNGSYYSALRNIGVYMDGLYHWWAKSESKNIGENLLSFDFTTEMLIKTPMPTDIDGRFEATDVDDCFEDTSVMKNLVMLNGSIALISSNPGVPDAFHISILGKLGVRESWINLTIVGSLPFVEFPIGVEKSNNVVISNEYDDELIWFNNELVWVDLNTQMIGILHVNGDKLGNCQFGRYKKSFDPIGRINN